MELAQQLLYFISGLAIFFIGQKFLSQGLQILGGRYVKRIVHFKEVLNPISCFFNGAKLTVLAFSPTMTSLVLAGLINANLLKSRRSLPMMMGVTLGATIILSILSLGTHGLGLSLIAMGLLTGLFIRTYRTKTLGKSILGLGLAFLGISVMEESFKLLVTWEEVANALLFIEGLNSHYSLILSTIIGLVLALSLSSSTMVHAMLLVLAKLQAIPILFCFGLNMGSLVSFMVMTFLATRREARIEATREVFVPLLSLVVSVIITITFTPYIINDIKLSLGPIGSILLGSFVISVSAFLFSYLFRGSLSSLSKRLFPDSEIKEQSKLKFLGERRYLSSSMAYVLVEMEIAKLMDIVNRMFLKCEQYLDRSNKGARALAKIKDYERIIDTIQFEIDLFIEKVVSSGSGDDDSKKILGYLKLSSSLELIADDLDKLATTQTRFYERFELTDDEKEKLLGYFKQTHDVFIRSLKAFTDHRVRGAGDTREVYEIAKELKKALVVERENFTREYKDEDIHKIIYFSDIIAALHKIRGQARDIYLTVHR